MTLRTIALAIILQPFDIVGNRRIATMLTRYSLDVLQSDTAAPIFRNSEENVLFLSRVHRLHGINVAIRECIWTNAIHVLVTSADDERRFYDVVHVRTVFN